MQFTLGIKFFEFSKPTEIVDFLGFENQRFSKPLKNPNIYYQWARLVRWSCTVTLNGPHERAEAWEEALV